MLDLPDLWVDGYLGKSGIAGDGFNPLKEFGSLALDALGKVLRM
jgi:hypothetical protein